MSSVPHSLFLIYLFIFCLLLDYLSLFHFISQCYVTDRDSVLSLVGLRLAAYTCVLSHLPSSNTSNCLVRTITIYTISPSQLSCIVIIDFIPTNVINSTKHLLFLNNHSHLKRFLIRPKNVYIDSHIYHSWCSSCLCTDVDFYLVSFSFCLKF